MLGQLTVWNEVVGQKTWEFQQPTQTWLLPGQVLVLFHAFALDHADTAVWDLPVNHIDEMTPNYPSKIFILFYLVHFNYVIFNMLSSTSSHMAEEYIWMTMEWQGPSPDLPQKATEMINLLFIPLKSIPLVALLLCLVPKSNFLLLLLLNNIRFLSGGGRKADWSSSIYIDKKRHRQLLELYCTQITIGIKNNQENRSFWSWFCL